jgi:hypothetical protein
MTKVSIKAQKENNKKFTITMINRNGYTIVRKFNTIQACKDFAKFYPLSVFFAWIYNNKYDEMIMQNNYRDSFFKCNNETFIPCN